MAKSSSPKLRLTDRAVRSAQPIGTAPIVSDGALFIAYRAELGVLRTVNARSGERRDIRLPGNCGPLSAAYTRILLSCLDTETSGRRYAIARTKQSDTVSVSSPGGREDHYDEIGRYWLRGVNCEVGHCGSIYFELSTGRYVSVAEGLNRRDPNTPNLEDYDPARYVTLSEGGALLAKLPGRNRRWITLSRCEVPCRGARAGSDRVTWVEGVRVLAYDLRKRRQYQWIFRSARVQPAVPLAAVPTATGAYMAVPGNSAEATPARYTVYRARF